MAGMINQGDSSSPYTRQWDYDVFLSFRGVDTRNGFTGHLYKALLDNGIITFMDKDLDRGETISVKLVEYIKSSLISIIIFSQNFVSSSCCLDELVEILKCKQNGQLVIPIFYKVDPSELCEQKGNFEVALAEQQNKFKHSIEKVQRWSAALSEVADICGKHYKDDGFEYKVIQEITADILHIKSCSAAIEFLLDVEANDFRMVGIYRTKGMVRTTIAKDVYRKIANHFDRTCFLENVSENSRTSDSTILVQKKLLVIISGGKHLNVESVACGTNMIREWLQRERVLLILNDVDEPNQIENLIGSCDRFVSRSRVLITTGDKKVLATLGKVCKTHKVELEKIGSEYARDVPLAIKIVGTDLFGRIKSKWEGVIRQFGERDHKRRSKL